MIILGRKLQRLREERGLSLREVAAQTRGSLGPSKLSAIETAKRPVTAFDVAGLCRTYKASHALTDQLERMAEEALSPGWWEPYSTYMLEDFAMLLELEEVCSAINVYQSELIPGLMQTDEYARAIHAPGPVLDMSAIDQAVALRALRQQRFWGRDPLPAIQVVIHESAITRPICSSDGDQAQRAQLLEIARSGRADIRVLSSSAGAHPSMKGSYTILSSGMAEISDAVYTETITGARYEPEATAVEACRTFFEATAKMANPIEEYLI